MLLAPFIRNLEAEGYASLSDTLLLAVSGGIDSMVMWDLFRRAGYRVAVAHCNFALRGQDSDADERMVREQAEAQHVPFHAERFDTKAYAASHKISVEMAARELRYRFFAGLCTRYGYKAVATAHHADDAIETWFLHLGRGAGIHGLQGMSSGGSVIRPLLFATRQQIASYAQQHAISYREDATNQSDQYLRNRIRHQLLPVFGRIFPSYRSRMQHTMRLMSDVEKIYDGYMESTISKIVTADDGGLTVHIPSLCATAAPLSVLYELLHTRGFSERQLYSIWKTLQRGRFSGKTFRSASWTLWIDREYLFIEPASTQDAGGQVVIPASCTSLQTPVPLRFDMLPVSRWTLCKEASVAQLDADRVTFPLVLRKWRAGDAFCPLGMSGRTKKVSDYWIDRKLPLREKRTRWILCDRNQIVWLVGDRIDDRVKVTSSTRQVLYITLNG